MSRINVLSLAGLLLSFLCPIETAHAQSSTLCPMGMYGQINGVYYYVGYVCCDDCGYCSYGQAESPDAHALRGTCLPPCTDECDLINPQAGSDPDQPVALLATPQWQFFCNGRIDEIYDRAGGAPNKLRDKLVRREDKNAKVEGQGKPGWPGGAPGAPPFVNDRKDFRGRIDGREA